MLRNCILFYYFFKACTLGEDIFLCLNEVSSETTQSNLFCLITTNALGSILISWTSTSYI